MLAQEMCLEVPPYVGSEVPGVTGGHGVGVGSALGEEVRAISKPGTKGRWVSYLLTFLPCSFLCFIVAVSQSLDRLLIGGIFLLLLTFANQKIISKFFSSND